MGINLHTINDFKMHLPPNLSKQNREKIQLILNSYNINWVSNMYTILNLYNFVYISGRYLFHTKDIYYPFEGYVGICYKEILNGY